MFLPLEIKDQHRTDFCYGCAIASAAEQFVGEPCEESFSYAMGKKVSGQPLSQRGVPPKAALRAAVEYGVLPKRYSPYSIATQDRDFLADWRNWEGLQKFTVKPFRSFHRVYNIHEELMKTSLIAGLFWQGQWIQEYLEPVPNPHTLEPHEVRIIGEQTNYWIIQNSRGVAAGNKGLFCLNKNIPITSLYALSSEPWSNVLSELIAKYL